VRHFERLVLDRVALRLLAVEVVDGDVDRERAPAIAAVGDRVVDAGVVLDRVDDLRIAVPAGDEYLARRDALRFERLRGAFGQFVRHGNERLDVGMRGEDVRGGGQAGFDRQRSVDLRGDGDVGVLCQHALHALIPTVDEADRRRTFDQADRAVAADRLRYGRHLGDAELRPVGTDVGVFIGRRSELVRNRDHRHAGRARGLVGVEQRVLVER
jgi:hypothetical protein